MGRETGGYSPSKEDEKINLERRRFIRDAGAVLAVGGAVAAVEDIRDGFIGRLFFGDSKVERPKPEQLEAEKKVLAVLVQAGIDTANDTDRTYNEYNDLITRAKALDKDSTQGQELRAQARALSPKVGSFPTRRIGDIRTTNLIEANPYAQKLLSQEGAIDGLAKLRLAYKKESGLIEKSEFKYEHNDAAAYLELAKLPPGAIELKIKDLAKYCKKTGCDLQDIRPQDVIYSLLDSAFDFNLTAAAMEQFLDKRNPRWKQTPATQFDIYASNNDLTKFNVFELNRLRQIAIQMTSPKFKDKIFSERDRDLTKRGTELGGVIPFPEKEKNLTVIDPIKQRSDNAYIVPSQRIVQETASVGDYHFHATQADEPDKGPSVGDTGSPIASVVFTSLSPTEIAAHMYVARYNPKSGYHDSLHVISVGVMEKEHPPKKTRR